MPTPGMGPEQQMLLQMLQQRVAATQASAPPVPGTFVGGAFADMMKMQPNQQMNGGHPAMNGGPPAMHGGPPAMFGGPPAMNGGGGGGFDFAKETWTAPTMQKMQPEAWTQPAMQMFQPQMESQAPHSPPREYGDSFNNGAPQGAPQSKAGGCAPQGVSPPQFGGGGAAAPTMEELANNGAKHCSGATIDDQEVKVQDASGRQIPNPPRYATFEAAPFPETIQARLRQAGFPAPSQVQQYCWPISMQGQDVIGVAATGSGKTLAFLLPAMALVIERQMRPSDPMLVCIAPTRELAIQIQAEAEKFGSSAGFKTVCCYGGAPKPPQAQEIRNGLHGIIGTPGRINDFLEGGQLRLGQVNKLVLDEADRMLDMGFEPQIRKILLAIPAQRHTMFFTATWPPSVRRLASEFLRGAYTVTIGNRDELKGNQDITQSIMTCRGNEKNSTLMQLLRQAGVADRSQTTAKGLVFCQTKRMCDQLTQQLERSGVPCAAIHGDKQQREREQALNGLKEGQLKLLVATDVAARGLDIKGVTLVVNFDPPSQIEDYVHRIGRTGRAGQKGCAVTIISERDTHALRGIIEVMKRTNQLMIPQIEAIARDAPRPPRKGGKGGGKDSGPSFDPNFVAGLNTGGGVASVAPPPGGGGSAPPGGGGSAPPGGGNMGGMGGGGMSAGMGGGGMGMPAGGGGNGMDMAMGGGGGGMGMAMGGGAGGASGGGSGMGMAYGGGGGKGGGGGGKDGGKGRRSPSRRAMRRSPSRRRRSPSRRRQRSPSRKRRSPSRRGRKSPSRRRNRSRSRRRGSPSVKRAVKEVVDLEGDADKGKDNNNDQAKPKEEKRKKSRSRDRRRKRRNSSSSS